MTAETARRKKARDIMTSAGYRVGGHIKGDKVKKTVKKGVAQHEEHDHPGKKKTVLKLKDGGVAEGREPKPRADRLARGGKTHKGKAHTQVNVIVGGQHPKPVPVPVPKPVPVPVPVDPNAAAAGAGGPPPPGGMPPPGMDPNAPTGLKKGGRAPKDKIDSQRDPIGGIDGDQFKKGGRTKGYPIEDGAGGGKGRLEKIKAYG